jgi:hypothetical protein
MLADEIEKLMAERDRLRDRLEVMVLSWPEPGEDVTEWMDFQHWKCKEVLRSLYRTCGDVNK